MSSRGKKKTTMAKLNRDARLRERRTDKLARKQARRDAAAAAPDLDPTAASPDLDSDLDSELDPEHRGSPPANDVGALAASAFGPIEP